MWQWVYVLVEQLVVARLAWVEIPSVEQPSPPVSASALAPSAGRGSALVLPTTRVRWSVR
jgi:hypothetical protein